MAKAINTDAGRSVSGASRSFRRRLSYLRLTWLACLGVVVLILVVLFAALAPYLTPFSPSLAAVEQRLKPPLWTSSRGEAHLLGTDYLGRDIWARIVHGAHISLLVGMSTALIGGLLGTSLGLLAGYCGGIVDDAIMRVADVQLALPGMLLYIAILSVLGGSLLNIILILGITDWVGYARVVRGQTLALRNYEFVQAAHSIGAGAVRIMLRHILPNILAPIIVIGSFGAARNILAEASLSFLGVGVPPSIPTWGAMLSEGRDYLRVAWWPVTFPGMALALVVLGINSIGDWLRDFLDPRLKI